MDHIESMVQMQYLKHLKSMEKARQDESSERLAMLRDDFEAAVIKKINKCFTDPDSKAITNEYVNTSQNPYKKIVSRLSKCYKKAPVRIFKRDGEILKADQIEDIIARYNEAGFDKKMKSANLFLNAVNTVFVGPVYRDGKLCLDILTPDQVQVVPNAVDPTKIDALFIPKARWENDHYQRYWVVWTAESHYMIVEIGRHDSPIHGVIDLVSDPMPVGDNKDMVNPWGVIPYVDIHRTELESEFWDQTSGGDLYEFGVCVAYRNTLLDFAATWQSFKQLAVESDEKPTANPTLSPGTALWGSRGAKWSAIDLQVNFEQIRGDLEKYAASVARNYGVTLEGYNVPSQQSGAALKVVNQELTDIWTDQLEIFRDAESRLWELIKIISEKEGLGNWAGIDLDIRYTSMSTGGDKEELELDAMKMERGLISPIAVYMKYNDTVVDEVEALENIKANLKLMNELKPSVTKIGVFDELPDEEE